MNTPLNAHIVPLSLRDLMTCILLEKQNVAESASLIILRHKGKNKRPMTPKCRIWARSEHTCQSDSYHMVGNFGPTLIMFFSA
jgi:hypothetical protein